MELDIAKTLQDKLQDKFNALFNKMESKFNNDLNELETFKYSFYDIDKEVNENLTLEIKEIGEGKKLKKFYSNNTIDVKRNEKSEHVNKEPESKFKKNDAKARSKTPLSRNNQTKSSINITEHRGKSIKPQTERVKNLNNMTHDADHFKSERPSPKQKKNNTTLNFIKEPVTAKKLNKNCSVERIRDERKNKDNPINKLKKDPIKKINNLNKTTIISKKNLNISADIKPQFNKEHSHRADDKSEKSIKVGTPSKKNDSIITLQSLSETIKTNDVKNEKQSEALEAQLLKNENNVNENTIKQETNINNETEKKQEIKPPRRLSIFIDNKSKLEDSGLISNSRALRLYTISGFCNIKKGLWLNLIDKNLNPISNSTKNLILKNYLLTLNNEVNQLYNSIQTYVEDSNMSEQINKQFNPSKTAINGLNFVNQTEEQNLIKKEQPIEIINVFKLIYILLNENYEEIEDNKILENLITKILPKLKFESLKTVFLTIVKNLSVSERQVESLAKMFSENPKIISSPDLLKLNKCVSFMTFIIKEIYEYVNSKFSDGTLVLKIRLQIAEYNSKKEKIEKLKKFIV